MSEKLLQRLVSLSRRKTANQKFAKVDIRDLCMTIDLIDQLAKDVVDRDERIKELEIARESTARN